MRQCISLYLSLLLCLLISICVSVQFSGQLTTYLFIHRLIDRYMSVMYYNFYLPFRISIIICIRHSFLLYVSIALAISKYPYLSKYLLYDFFFLATSVDCILFQLSSISLACHYPHPPKSHHITACHSAIPSSPPGLRYSSVT